MLLSPPLAGNPQDSNPVKHHKDKGDRYMQILITFKNVDASEYLKTYVEEKLERLEKIMISAVTADVVFQEEKQGKRVDVKLTGKGIEVHATETGGAWNEAIDLVVDKVKKQLVRTKDKIQDHRAEPARG